MIIVYYLPHAPQGFARAPRRPSKCSQIAFKMIPKETLVQYAQQNYNKIHQHYRAKPQLNYSRTTAIKQLKCIKLNYS